LNFKIAGILIVLFAVIISCGEGLVEVQNRSYQLKIAIDGFLVPGRKVERIHIFRNFKLDQDLNDINFFPQNTTAILTDDSNPDQVYPLTLRIPDILNPEILDLEEFYYEYTGNDLTIEYGKSYTLEVNTTIDGKNLWTRSTTTVPQQGFKINSLNYDSLKFAQEKENGDLQLFEVTLQRSPGVTYYLGTITPLDTTFDSLIKEHLVEEIDEQMYMEDLDSYIFVTTWIQNTPLFSGESIMRLFWFDFYFYSEYEIIVYAVDDNFKDYLQTYNSVQEPDGNFHEANFNFEGDGIGIFGSYIADTTYLHVTQ
jgi:hypothetical protein